MKKVLSGCKHYVSCFTCPFSDCILGVKATGNKMRGWQVEKMVSEGKSDWEIARAVGIRPDTVRRNYRRGC